jgi:4-hydroxybenzoate polyprenyltransferase
MLLFWPCAWGLTLAYDFSNNLHGYFIYLLLFFLGAVFMRSAGCIVNDILDKDFDKRVLRTKNRPIASNQVSIKIALLLAGIFCLLSFLILINFNKYTVLLALGSMPLAFSYPLMKRYTYWPQLFLGITFNYGLILGWTSIKGQVDIIPILIYIGAIFWTLGYDTIYGFQDIKDDEIIGLKSTSIKFKSNPYIFLYLCFSIFIILIASTGYIMSLSSKFFFFVLLIFIHMFYFQLFKLNINNPNNCLHIFKSNNFLGFLIYIALIIGKY